MARKRKGKRKRKRKDRSRRMKDEGRSDGRDWAELDQDVLTLVFLKLGTLEVLRVGGAVCRSWREVATEEPEIWRKIDMASHEYVFEAFALMDPTRVAIDRAKGRVEELCLNYLGDDELLRYLCDRTSVLKKLCLLSCWQVSQNGIAETAKRQPLLEDLEITIGSFEQNVTEVIGRECPQLKSLKFNTVWYNSPPSSSEEDEDDEDDDDEDDDEEDDEEDDDEEEEEDDDDEDEDDNDEDNDDDEDDVEALRIANNLHELHNFHLIGEDEYDEEDDEDDEDDDDDEEEDDPDAEALGIANNLHELRHLQLIGNRMTNAGLKAILDGCPYLETLDIRRCRNLKINGDMWARCARLKTVRLPEDPVDDYPYEADNDHDIMM